jgi:hypothetical protein
MPRIAPSLRPDVAAISPPARVRRAGSSSPPPFVLPQESMSGMRGATPDTPGSQSSAVPLTRPHTASSATLPSSATPDKLTNVLLANEELRSRNVRGTSPLQKRHARERPRSGSLCSLRAPDPSPRIQAPSPRARTLGRSRCSQRMHRWKNKCGGCTAAIVARRPTSPSTATLRARLARQGRAAKPSRAPCGSSWTLRCVRAAGAEPRGRRAPQWLPVSRRLRR